MNKVTAVPEGKDTKNRAVSVTTVGAQVLRQEADALAVLARDLGTKGSALHQGFIAAVRAFSKRKGRVVVSGMGKSGHVGRKVAATLASTGTPATFVHPAEASHGDLGMIVRGDAVLALSNSGKSVELGTIVKHAKRNGVPLVVITSNKDSPLGQAADILLPLPKVPEACALGLAPTTSTTMTLALGDALAVGVMQKRHFTAADFGRLHPGGSLGSVLQHVEAIMHQGKKVPLVRKNEKMSKVVVTMTEDGFGCAGVVNKKGVLVGIITDGDLRRHIDDRNLFKRTAEELMTPKPVTVSPNMMTAETLRIINEQGVTQVFVTDGAKRPVGIVHVHDLLRAKVA